MLDRYLRPKAKCAGSSKWREQWQSAGQVFNGLQKQMIHTRCFWPPLRRTPRSPTKVLYLHESTIDRIGHSNQSNGKLPVRKFGNELIGMRGLKNEQRSVSDCLSTSNVKTKMPPLQPDEYCEVMPTAPRRRCYREWSMQTRQALVPPRRKNHLTKTTKTTKTDHHVFTPIPCPLLSHFHAPERFDAEARPAAASECRDRRSE